MKRVGFVLCFIIGVMVLSAGCSSPQTDETASPVLSDISIDTYNEGTEDSQYVKVVLNFDRPVTLSGDPEENLRLTIAEERMDIESMTASEEEVTILVPVEAITRGNLVIEEEKEGKGYPGILDESGRYCAASFQAEMLIPSGITLSDVDSYEGKGFCKKVEGIWNIRNITWLILTEDGVPVPSRMDNYLDNMDDAVALHGHDFLICDTTMIAADMAEALNDHFGNYFLFRSEGEEIIGERLDGSLDTELDLSIYEYKKIEN